MHLPHHDHAQPGPYFVTACSYRRACLFGQVADGVMEPNDFGRIVERCWADLPSHFPEVVLDGFVVMPNHVHGLTGLIPDRGGARHTLSDVVGAFKAFSARRINERCRTPSRAIWQRGYHEHVVRRDEALDRIRAYIATNPIRWYLDRENPINHRGCRGGSGTCPYGLRTAP
ncbi:MAG: transposase [Alphaproteobacteria bacterium]|nr:transposase [Alphaproteobacteria bacterium]